MLKAAAGQEPGLGEHFRQVSERLRSELDVYRLVLRHPRTPRLSKVLLAGAIGYAALPFDLIPDFLPVVGHVDDLVVIPALVALAVWLLPEGLLRECRTIVRDADFVRAE